MKKIITGAIILTALTVSANAVCASYGCTGEVTRLQVTSTGNIQVGIDGDASAMNCTAVAGAYSEVDLSAPGGNAIYSALLTAQTTGKPILVRIIEGSENCAIGYVKP